MLIDNTNETIELVLAASVTTNQATFSCSFNEFSSNTFSGNETNGTSNNTTAVTLVASPSSGFQRQVRELIIENNDTASITVTIRFNNTSVTRIIMKAILAVGDSLTYSAHDGWNCKDTNGGIRFYNIHINPTGSVRGPEFFPVSAAATTTTLGANVAGQYLGKAEKAYSSIDFRYRVDTAIAGTQTFSELAVYRISNRMSIGTQQVWTRLGFTNCAAVWNSTGLKTTNVALTGCRTGDDLYVIWASNNTTSMAPRSGNYADPISSILQVTTTTVASWRPSTSPLYQATSFTAAASAVWVLWQGN
jgi:hypothetical protein